MSMETLIYYKDAFPCVEGERLLQLSTVQLPENMKQQPSMWRIEVEARDLTKEILRQLVELTTRRKLLGTPSINQKMIICYCRK